MKASKFTEAQIAVVLKQAQDGAPVAEVCRKAGISDAISFFAFVIRQQCRQRCWRDLDGR